MNMASLWYLLGRDVLSIKIGKGESISGPGAPSVFQSIVWPVFYLN